MKPRLEVSSRSNISGELNAKTGMTEVRHDAGQAISLKESDVRRLHQFLGKVLAYRPARTSKRR